MLKIDDWTKKYIHVGYPPIPELIMTNVNGKRHYRTPDGTFISITTLLSSKVPESILQWRERVGDDVADYVMQTAARRGTAVHKMVEATLSNEPICDVTECGVLPMALFNMMRPALDRIDNIRGLEKSVYSTELGVAGTADAICEFDGEPSIVDFKTASRMRDKDSIANYFLQCTFYSQAWFEQVGEVIKKIVIVMVSEDGKMQVYQDKPSSYIDRLRQLTKEYKDALHIV